VCFDVIQPGFDGPPRLPHPDAITKNKNAALEQSAAFFSNLPD
jgi:hypothetical protein